jgi:hypothetical protein
LGGKIRIVRFLTFGFVALNLVFLLLTLAAWLVNSSSDVKNPTDSLNFIVMDDDDKLKGEFIGQASLPLSEFQDQQQQYVPKPRQNLLLPSLEA